MRTIVVAAAAACLSACGAQGENDDKTSQAAGAGPAAPSSSASVQGAAAPDLGACPTRELLEKGLRQRSGPIAVPATLREAMRSDMDNFAFATFGGATICVDASWMEGIRNPALSPDGRFASFDWDGYEAFGHVIVDRSGKGAVLDTGVQPVASPSGKMLAAADLSESGYGALNAFAAWRIEPRGIRQLAKQAEVPPAYDWRIEGWVGETCVDLSSVPSETFTGQSNDPRERFRAREGTSWRLEAGRCSDA